jgi:hypothetical protein
MIGENLSKQQATNDVHKSNYNQAVLKEIL